MAIIKLAVEEVVVATPVNRLCYGKLELSLPITLLDELKCLVYKMSKTCQKIFHH